jgi:hypothetical protein
MARSLGIETVAEGIETEAQATGCARSSAPTARATTSPAAAARGPARGRADLVAALAEEAAEAEAVAEITRPAPAAADRRRQGRQGRHGRRSPAAAKPHQARGPEAAPRVRPELRPSAAAPGAPVAGSVVRDDGRAG